MVVLIKFVTTLRFSRYDDIGHDPRNSPESEYWFDNKAGAAMQANFLHGLSYFCKVEIFTANDLELVTALLASSANAAWQHTATHLESLCSQSGAQASATTFFLRAITCTTQSTLPCGGKSFSKWVGAKLLYNINILWSLYHKMTRA